MRAHLTWIGAAAVAVMTSHVPEARAQQYAPYRPQQQVLPQTGPYSTTYPTTAQAPLAPSNPASASQAVGSMSRYTQAATLAPAPTAAQAAAPVAPATVVAPTISYPQYAATAAQAPTQVPAYAYPQTTYPQTAQAPVYQMAQAPSYTTTSSYATYPSVAQQPTPPAPTESEQIPAPTPSTSGKGNAVPGRSAAGGSAPTGSMGNGYPTTGYQTANGYSGYGQASSGYTDYGIAGCCEPECGGHVWFGGVYWLFMERDNPRSRKLTVQVDHANGAADYYPQANDTVLDTNQMDYDFRSGVEVRFGSTFSIGSACDDCYGYGNACGCGGCPQDNYAWEVAWWGLDEDNQDVGYGDRDPFDDVRLYGMVNFAGIEYFDGAGWRPVNEYYGYGLPISDPSGVPAGAGDVVVLSQFSRSWFSTQNIELNFIRFPVCNISCGGGCGGCGTGGDCGYGACGCDTGSTPIAFSMCGMCGVRYFRIDDDFFYGSRWAEWNAGFGPSSWINYNISVDNNLIGPQVGWNMNYCVGSKWNFFCNSTFGVFNNHMRSHQRLWGDNGNARYIETPNRSAVSNSSKDDVSFLGELRLGGSYDITCNWRAVLAYRALAITGVANSVDQIPTDFSNAQYPGIIDSDASIVIHGVQVGAECRY